jgi:hypothetical protein
MSNSVRPETLATRPSRYVSCNHSTHDTIIPPNPLVHARSNTVTTPANCFDCSLIIAQRNARDIVQLWEARIRDASLDFLSRTSEYPSTERRRYLEDTWHSGLHDLHRRRDRAVEEVWMEFMRVWDGGLRTRNVSRQSLRVMEPWDRMEGVRLRVSPRRGVGNVLYARNGRVVRVEEFDLW